MEKIKCNVIVCGPAVGKTFLANNDSRFVDLDEIKGRYKYGLEDVDSKEYEYGKLNRKQKVRDNSTEYAIKVLEEKIKSNHIVLLSYNKNILKYLQDNNIDYCLVYASFDAKEEYIRRMKERNNNEEFIKEMTSKQNWEMFYNENVNDTKATYKIELGKDKYLFDIKNYFL